MVLISRCLGSRADVNGSTGTVQQLGDWSCLRNFCEELAALAEGGWGVLLLGESLLARSIVCVDISQLAPE